MIVFDKIAAIKSEINKLLENNKSIGFVPTMGALHSGHISLTEYSKKQNDITIVSIFVNPTQFNNKQDLIKYPRNLEKDAAMCREAGVDIIFAPTGEEMYPEKDTRVFNFGKLEEVMEGKFRPGHFNGVAQIVSKLFDAVPAHKAYFGEKDFQQLAIIKKMVADLNYKIEIVPCPIVREANGLAMSSRNERLTKDQREHAAIIFKSLKESVELVKVNDVETAKALTISKINEDQFLKVEYFEIVDYETLKSISDFNLNRPMQACVAVFAGEVRLIDNIRLK
jgi:pantoate--beta-alanine ligase